MLLLLAPKLLRSLLKNDLPSLCERFSGQLRGDYFTGDSLSAVDISVYAVFAVILDRAGDRGAAKVIARYPALLSFIERVGRNERVRAYMARTHHMEGCPRRHRSAPPAQRQSMSSSSP